MVAVLQTITVQISDMELCHCVGVLQFSLMSKQPGLQHAVIINNFGRDDFQCISGH